MTRAASFRILLLAVLMLLVAAVPAVAWTPKPVREDPLVFMPGTQPGTVQNFENSGRCENCHSGYNQAVEPGSNWRGSMMAQAARDPLWLACLTASAQDSIWAVGTPNATDICIRCHSPQGWLEGASDPTNTSALAGNQLDGVACDFCHRKIDPFAKNGQPDVPADTNATAASLATQTLSLNLADLGVIKLFDGSPFLNATSGLPTFYGPFPAYSENGAGQYFAAASSGPKYGPFADPDARHQWNYSRYHKSKEFCHSCHDVSNPVMQNLPELQGNTANGTTRNAAASYFHVERTSSEFLLSAYGNGGADTPGIPGVGVANKCQDCHLRDVTGVGCNKVGAPIRPDLPLHDMTGGNQWLAGILASVDQLYTAGYDPVNHAILSGTRYPGAKIDVAGIQTFGDELARGKQRAIEQLKMAATIEEVSSDASQLTLRVVNNTGHKLISGFPEGRRMFLNVKWYSDTARTNEIGEINGYTPLSLDGTTGAVITNENPELVWEAKMSSSLTNETKTFHFALADGRYKDNRIPPKGFRSGAEMLLRYADPIVGGISTPGLFTPAEYLGGYDEFTLLKPAGAVAYKATLYYQTTSREYIEFLRDEINGTGTLTLPASAYLVQDTTDPVNAAFFANLKDWGTAIWDLYVHNGGAAPVEMATFPATTSEPVATVSAPTSLSGTYNRKTKAITLKWVAPTTGANGYYVYKGSTSGGPYTKMTTATPITATSFTDSGPFTLNVPVYYTVSAHKLDKLGNVIESAKSNQATVTPK